MTFRFFLLLLVMSLAGCTPNPTTGPPAGVALSFDDHFVEDWIRLRPLLNKYHAKVTFYINCPDSLSAQEISWLRQLQNDGHEIGFHGTIHGRSTDLIETLGVDGYVSTELQPGLAYLRQAGITPTSYAHPGGNHNARVDSVLLASGFTILRDVSLAEREYKGFRLYHLPPRFIPGIYYGFDGETDVNALLFDTSANLSVEELQKALRKAKEKRKALLLFGHQPFFAKPRPEQYGFDVSVLEKILQTSDSLELRFYRMSELVQVRH